MRFPDGKGQVQRAFSRDVTSAILVFLNNDTAAMLVSPINPVGVELFSYAKTFFCASRSQNKTIEASLASLSRN